MHQEYSLELMRERIAKGNDRPDFFGHLLNNKSDQPSEEFLRTNASSLLIAGAETTATALAGMTYYVLERPECLRALQDEVRSAFTSPEEINNLSTRDLHYLNATIKEALRIFIPLPIHVPRVSPGANVIGHYVPKGVYRPAFIPAQSHSRATMVRTRTDEHVYSDHRVWPPVHSRPPPGILR